jgi:C4-dicarboxylate-specific signal transduction histidine kinase
MPQPVFRAVRRDVADALKVSRMEEDELDRRSALLAPLASAGMIALALNHELTRERHVLERSVARLDQLASKHQIPELAVLASQLKSTTGRLNAIHQLFAPMLSDSDMEAGDRLKIAPIVHEVVDGMRPLTPGLVYELSGLQRDQFFPIGSHADWSAFLVNAISNAWNATLASNEARVSFESGVTRTRNWLRISDTGVGLGVPLDEAAAFFQPFRRRLQVRKDLESLLLGGQGLGLAITRMIALRRNATVAFVEPSANFSTTLELAWKA